VNVDCKVDLYSIIVYRSYKERCLMTLLELQNTNCDLTNNLFFQISQY